MVYAMSDIHGYYGKFTSMLKQINFSNKDELYIVGDVIDRGPAGIKILKEVMETPNIHMLMGNHEHMMLAFFDQTTEYVNPYDESYMRQLWFQNGGEETIYDFRNEPEEMQQKILEFIRSLPYDKKLTVNDRKFILAHAFPNGEPSKEDKAAYFEYQMTSIWERIDGVFCPQIPEDMIAIVGHTPTVNYERDMDPYHMVYLNKRIIDIDCGMARSDIKRRRLGCIRLDDMREFYI